MQGSSTNQLRCVRILDSPDKSLINAVGCIINGKIRVRGIKYTEDSTWRYEDIEFKSTNTLSTLNEYERKGTNSLGYLFRKPKSEVI